MQRAALLLSIPFALLLSLAAHAREKTDVIALRNGDRITGEILSLEYGILQVKTDNMGTLKIEWPAIVSVRSQHTFFVEHIDGPNLFGTIRTADDGNALLVDTEGRSEALPLLDVTRLSQVETSFWSRLDGSLSVGYNFTKSSDVSITSLSFTAVYRTQKLESITSLSTVATKSPEGGTKDRDQLFSSTKLYRSNRNFWLYLKSLERNEELGIDSRLQLGAAIGRHFVQTSYAELSGFAGLSFNQEWITGSEGAQQSLEAVLGGGWRMFRFSDPETSLNASVMVYPSLTESGRYRTELNATLSRELIKDLTLGFTYYNSYDSEPPDDTASKSDYGIVTSLGYRF